MTQVIVLNGGSSSGKTGIARCLQAILPAPWIRLSVDDLVAALPPSLLALGSGIAFGQQGEVIVGGAFREIEAAWMAGAAAARAVARGDRAAGMAAAQATMVHQDVAYDVQVDTSQAESLDCARVIAAHVA